MRVCDQSHQQARRRTMMVMRPPSILHTSNTIERCQKEPTPDICWCQWKSDANGPNVVAIWFHFGTCLASRVAHPLPSNETQLSEGVEELDDPLARG